MICKEATRLLSEAQDRPLGGMEQASLKFHLIICRGCRNFGQQVSFLHAACTRYDGGQEETQSGQP